MVSRLDGGALPQHPVPIDLREFLLEAVATVPAAEGLVSIDAEPDVEIEVDPNHLARVLVNLIENATKYAPESKIEVTAAQTMGRVAIAVADHGPGISPDRRKDAFEPFSQLDPADTRSQGGTGLGLSIVKSLAELMGGSISLTTTPGGGATFTVVLPVQPGLVRRTPEPAAT